VNPYELIKGINATGFVSHFFCQIDSSLNEKSDWEIGFYDKKSDNITTYVNGKIKNTDDVFKKLDDTVEKLELNHVTVELEDAKKMFLENCPTLFPSEQLGDGFLILQTLHGKTHWNFTLISKSLKFLNIKINTSTGEVDEHQIVELVQK